MEEWQLKAIIDAVQRHAKIIGPGDFAEVVWPDLIAEQNGWLPLVVNEMMTINCGGKTFNIKRVK